MSCFCAKFIGSKLKLIEEYLSHIWTNVIINKILFHLDFAIPIKLTKASFTVTLVLSQTSLLN